MMRRFELLVLKPVQQTRRAASATRGEIRGCTPEGLGGIERSHCGAVAGKSAHGPMT